MKKIYIICFLAFIGIVIAAVALLVGNKKRTGNLKNNPDYLFANEDFETNFESETVVKETIQAETKSAVICNNDVYDFFDVEDTKECYYIISEIDNEIVIFYDDFVTIYDYTGIKTDTLDTELKKQLRCGIQVKSMSDLYHFLEEHTS